jgi:Putative peptidoglycan binding domain
MFDMIPIVYRVLQHRDEIMEIKARLEPYIVMLKADKDLFNKIVNLANKIMQGDVAPEAPSMEWIQSKLNVWGAATQPGWVPLKVDGKLGARTQQAIEQFQTAMSLKADGNFGARSYAAMCGWLLRNGQQVAL